jgi:negative regulator of flagellin synthesis FlgM
VKVNDSVKKSPSVGVGPSAPKTGKAAESAAPSAPAKPASDNVHLSTQVQNLAASHGSGAVFDSGKVQEIKAAIAEGKFQVDPEKVANGLLDTVSDLIRTRKG